MLLRSLLIALTLAIALPLQAATEVITSTTAWLKR